MSDNDKKKKIQSESRVNYPDSNKTVITRTYEDGTTETKEINQSLNNIYNPSKGASAVDSSSENLKKFKMSIDSEPEENQNN